MSGAGEVAKASIASAAEQARHERMEMARRRKQYPWWTTFAQGRVYRPLMKVMHRFGWCYPSPTPVEEGRVWCQWCGMRGRVQ